MSAVVRAEQFESPEVATAMREFLTSASEQVFARPQALLTC